MSVDRVLSKLHKVRKTASGWQALCPAHDDREPSLAIREVEGGKVLVKCHAGCETDDVLGAVGLRMQDLFTGELPPQREVPQFGGAHRVQPKLVAAYPYRAASGELLYEACRYEPKGFRQRRPDGAGGYLWNLEGIMRVPYRLPELLASKPSEAVWIPEGERDVDSLVKLGLVATCNVGGAGKWKDEYSEHLRGRMVVVLPDNDDAGRKHADKVARSLVGVAAAVKVVALPDLPPKGDVSDWIAAGGTKAQLVAIAKATSAFDPTGQPEAGEPEAEAGPEPVVEHAMRDEKLEATLVGWMLIAPPAERARWFGRVVPDLVTNGKLRAIAEAVLEEHGVTAEVDHVAVLSRVRARCGYLDNAELMLDDLDIMAERARDRNPDPRTLLAALDDWRLQRAVKRVQGLALAGAGRASVERMRASLAQEVELSPVEPALDYGDVITERARRYFAEARPKVVTVGLAPFDEEMGGFTPGLIYLASRPSVGKTAIAFRMARGIVETMRRPALFVSLEMKAGNVHDRVIADLAGIENRRVQRADFVDDAERKRVADASQRAYEMYAGKLFVIEDSSSTFDLLVAAMHRHMQAHPDTAGVFFDYLQLAHGTRAESREQEISGMSRTLKRFAEQYEVPMFALAQLNRSSETEDRSKKKEGRPRMRHLRGSGALEQDGDDIILLHVRDESRDDARSDEVLLYAYHDKVRNGPTAVYHFRFNRPYQRIYTDAGRAWSAT